MWALGIYAHPMLARGRALRSLAPAPTCLYLLYSGYQRRRLQLARRSDKARPSSLAAARLPPRARLSSAEIQGLIPTQPNPQINAFLSTFNAGVAGGRTAVTVPLAGSDRLAHGSRQQPLLLWGPGPATPPQLGRAPCSTGGWDGPFCEAHARLSFLPPGASLLGAFGGLTHFCALYRES